MKRKEKKTRSSVRLLRLGKSRETDGCLSCYLMGWPNAEKKARSGLARGARAEVRAKRFQNTSDRGATSP